MMNDSQTPFYTDVIMAGFGGQGLMFIGKLLAYSAMKEGKNVTWIPSYGPEMRGGTANCTVVISDEEIGSPVISKPQSLIIMNNPSLEAFEHRLKTNGNMFLSSSLVTNPITRSDIKIFMVPANEIAFQIGSEKVANVVMLGAYIAYTKAISKQTVLKSLGEMLADAKSDLLKANELAFEEGIKFVVQNFISKVE